MVCKSDQYIYVTGLHNFLFVLQDLVGKINSYLQRILLASNTLFQVFSDENKQPQK